MSGIGQKPGQQPQSPGNNVNAFAILGAVGLSGAAGKKAERRLGKILPVLLGLLGQMGQKQPQQPTPENRPGMCPSCGCFGGPQQPYPPQGGTSPLQPQGAPPDGGPFAFAGAFSERLSFAG